MKDANVAEEQKITHTTIEKKVRLTTLLSKELEIVECRKSSDFSAIEFVEIKVDSTSKKYESDDDGFVIDQTGKRVEPEVELREFIDQKKRTFYNNLLQSKYGEIENLIILAGAGASVGVGESQKGLTMVGLWDLLETENPAALTTLVLHTKYHEIDADGKIISDGLVKDLEGLLTKSSITNLINPAQDLQDAILLVKEFISEKCNIKMPEDAPHLKFLSKVLLRPQKLSRVKLFTSNYDTLFEQAASKEKYTVIDGFTFSSPRVFNGKYFDYDIIETKQNRQAKKDSTIPKLFYLFKMHGSINWAKADREIIQTDSSIAVENRIMVFPQDSKYEHSYEQPYFEMMARFQQALRIENSLLITIGFSFYDKHISSVIVESLKQNPSLNVITFNYPGVINNDKPYQMDLHRIAGVQSRVTLVGESFADLAREYPESLAHVPNDALDEIKELLKGKN